MCNKKLLIWVFFLIILHTFKILGKKEPNSGNRVAFFLNVSAKIDKKLGCRIYPTMANRVKISMSGIPNIGSERVKDLLVLPHEQKIFRPLPRGGTQFENDGMCRAKSACKNRTLTVQRKIGENRTLTVHFFSNFPPFFQKFPPFRAPKVFFFQISHPYSTFYFFQPLQCISRTSKNRPSTAAHDVGQTI